MKQEYTQPLEEPIHSNRNIFSVLQERAQRAPDQSLVEYVGKNGQWQSFSAEQFRGMVVAIAKGLIARGVMPGDSVAIIAHTSWQWTALDLAIMSIGALTVPVYETNSPAQVRTIFEDAHVIMVFAEDSWQREKVELALQQHMVVKDIYVIEKAAVDTIIEYGRAVGDDEFYEREQAVKGDDLATIVYTSGSTGTPKGVELTHSNFLFVTYSGVKSMPAIALRDHARLLLFLPLAHVFARYMQFFCFAGNVTLGLSSNLNTILADFSSFKPTFILAVPRIFEKIYNAASQKAGLGIKGRIFANATSVAEQWSRCQQRGLTIPPILAFRHAIYKNLVYSSIMEVFGGSVEYAVSGGAPMDSSIAHFFNGVGLPLLEGYGMTETCAPACVNPTSGYKIGTVGRPMQGVSFGVDDAGELCIKSPAVCSGYHNNPDLTRQQIQNGWLHTGDLGSIDEDGFIRLTGRKKDLIITAGGKNVSPGGIEAAVMTSPVVNQCLLVGEAKPFIAALITLDLKETNLWLKAGGAKPVSDLKEASHNAIVYAEVERAVSKANELVSRAESVRKFIILTDEFTEDNGMVTASLKARRQIITQRYHDLIDREIYGTSK